MLRWDESQLAEHQAKVSAARAIGGNARAAALTPERRSEIAKQGAAARWPEGATSGPTKRSRYLNVRTYFDRIWFDSIAEKNRYCELRLLERAGAIKDLVVHPVFDLHFGDTKVSRYVADTRYIENGKEIAEDVKSERTAALSSFQMKRRHMTAEYPDVELRVVMA